MQAPPLKDLRDLLRTEHLVKLTELCTGNAVPGAVSANPRPENHDTNIRACVSVLAPLTTLEWGAEKVRFFVLLLFCVFLWRF